MITNKSITNSQLKISLERFWEISAQKILSIESTGIRVKGAPVYTVEGKYTSRGWTEWTQGFQYGSALLQFDATDDQQFYNIGKTNTIERMTAHVGHFGVHDHGFNNVSTYGNLLRLMSEGKMAFNKAEKDLYEMALKLSGVVQANRWTEYNEGGFIYSFNGPHSLL